MVMLEETRSAIFPLRASFVRHARRYCGANKMLKITTMSVIAVATWKTGSGTVNRGDMKGESLRYDSMKMTLQRD